MRTFLKYLIIGLMLCNAVIAQENTYSLNEVVHIAKTQSVQAKAAHNKMNAAYWTYKLFRLEYKPEIKANGTLPNFNRSITQVVQDDGTFAFIPQRNVNYQAGLGLYQKIGLTGADVFIQSGLQRLDLLTDSSTYSSFLSKPILIGVNQPLFTFNQYKWDLKIAPMVYKESQREFVEAMEQVSIEAVNKFFNLLSGQVNLQIAELNKRNNQQTFKIAQGRYELGTIAENDLLQMELTLLESETDVERSTLQVQIAMMNLKTFLSISSKEKISLIPPEKLSDISVNVTQALDEALKNRKDVVSFDRMMLEAEREIARAKLDQFQMNVFATYGLSQSGVDLNQSIQNPQDQERIIVGLEIPIMNWGKGKASRKMAESNLDLMVSNLEMSRAQFEREVYLGAMQMPILKKTANIAARADSIGRKRYEITRQRYLIGNIEITELNLALKAKDAAKGSYISALRMYWYGYYRLRQLTLYDFDNNEPLVKGVELKN